MTLIKRNKVRLLFIVNEILKKIFKIQIYIKDLNSQKKSNLYTLCKNYVDNYNGENNSDMKTNGEWRFIKHNLRQCKIIFDIGANIGDWTTLALNINNNVNIHCFEPNYDAFNKLIQKDFPTNVICNNFGLSSIKGEKDLYIFENGSGLNSLYQRHGLENGWNLKPQQKKEKVKLDTLHNYCNEQNISKIDYMKIDVEGHELEVFKGGRDLFTNGYVNIIQFEYGGCNIDSRVLLKDIFEFFKGMDYDFYKIYPDYTKLSRRYDQRLENFQHQNWLIIKKGILFNR